MALRNVRSIAVQKKMEREKQKMCAKEPLIDKRTAIWFDEMFIEESPDSMIVEQFRMDSPIV